MSVIDHTSIAQAMVCIPLPRRKRGAQSAEAKESFEQQVAEWCQEIIRVAETMDYKIGARDWCYVLEVAGSLTKGEFDTAEKLITACRKNGQLPVDICGNDNGRPTANLRYIDRTSVKQEAEDILARIANAHLKYNPFSLWENQEYFVQMAVEKMGIYSLFEKPTAEFDVPLVNIGGWSDVNSRVAMMRRFSGELAHPDGCRLIAWMTWPHLHRIPELLAAWGFRYCTGRPWLKTWPKENGLILYPDSFAVGCGYEIRNTSEFHIIAKRGRPQRLDGTKLAGHIIAPRREHSRKPDCVRDEIAALFDGPRCELFARSRHPGFDSWGDQVCLFDRISARAEKAIRR